MGRGFNRALKGISNPAFHQAEPDVGWWGRGFVRRVGWQEISSLFSRSRKEKCPCTVGRVYARARVMSVGIPSLNTPALHQEPHYPAHSLAERVLSPDQEPDAVLCAKKQSQ